MKIYLACSKTMTEKKPGKDIPVSIPLFQKEAENIVEELNRYSAAELQEILHVNGRLAIVNKKRFMDFFLPDNALPAIFSYTGTAYKALNVSDFNSAELESANRRILIGSFLYGLLRPFDKIHPYRLEGNVELPSNNHESMFEFWKPLLTDVFIKTVKDDDGILVNLASAELCQLMDWKKVCNELTVFTPTFRINTNGVLKTVAMYSKMCRGAMTRWIIKNNISKPEQLDDFSYQGFKSEGNLNFVLA